jgi:hypothetical protein
LKLAFPRDELGLGRRAGNAREGKTLTPVNGADQPQRLPFPAMKIPTKDREGFDENHPLVGRSIAVTRRCNTAGPRAVARGRDQVLSRGSNG